MDPDYAAYFLNSSSQVIQYEMLDIYHPNFTKRYRIVRNSVSSVQVTLEDGVTQATFEYYPVKITPVGVRDNLDYAIKVDIGDVGEVLPLELDSVDTAGTYGTKPTLTYRTYRSDVLTRPLFGPIILEIENISFKREGATFEAKAPSLNINRTGQIYTFERFPMLKGFL